MEGAELSLKSLIVLISYHHNNTRKIAEIFSRVLDAPVESTQQLSPEDLQEYDLVGFGSGIYSEQHHETLLDFAERLPQVVEKKAFIFSTCGAPEKFLEETRLGNPKFHLALREKPRAKGYIIVDEFIYPGLNTNGFLRHFGGLNIGRPSAEDLKNAEAFAQNLTRVIEN